MVFLRENLFPEHVEQKLWPFLIVGLFSSLKAQTDLQTRRALNAAGRALESRPLANSFLDRSLDGFTPLLVILKNF